MTILEELKSYKDESFIDFQTKLSNTDYIVLGIRMPKMNELIKKYKNKDLDLRLGIYQEIDLLYFGTKLNNDFKNNKEVLLKNSKYIKSWVVTDKIKSLMPKMNFNNYYDLFISLNNRSLYERRLSYVLMINVAKDKNILDILKKIKLNEEYKVMIAEAWLISEIAIFYPYDIISYLSKIKDKDIKLFKTSINKLLSSYRISDEFKNIFKSL
jgi:3-methyladenine DNA glycosylase AlkD